MIYWAVIFFIVAIVAGVLGFGGIIGASFGGAQVVFFIFLALLAGTLLAGLFRKA